MGVRAQVQPEQRQRQTLFKDQFPDTLGGNGYIVNNSGSTEYFRLEVDNLGWNGRPSCPATSGPCAYPTTGTNAYSEAHKGYAVRLVTDAGSPAPVQGTVPGSTNCTNCSMSAMDDMTVFTPLTVRPRPSSRSRSSRRSNGLRGPDDQRRSVRIGDVGGGPAYVGLQEPDGVTGPQPTR